MNSQIIIPTAEGMTLQEFARSLGDLVREEYTSDKANPPELKFDIGTFKYLGKELPYVDVTNIKNGAPIFNAVCLDSENIEDKGNAFEILSYGCPPCYIHRASQNLYNLNR